jgi:hypothetical protein
MSVSNQFLTVEARKHTMLECFFISQKLAQYSTELEMILAEITKFEKFAGYVELLYLFLGSHKVNSSFPTSL